MIVRLELFGIGAKWSILFLGLVLNINPYVVTGVADDSDGDIVESESRTPYVYLRQQEYLVQPDGEYQEVADIPETNVTSSPPGTLRKYTSDLKRIQESSSEEEGTSADQDGAGSTSQRFENAHTRYSYGLNDEENEGQESSNKPASIQDVLDHKQGPYGVPAVGTTGPTGTVSYQTAGAPSPSYDHVTYQSPLVSYEVPSNYFPSEHFEWPSTYTTSPVGPLPLSGFLGSVGDLTASVKHVKSQLGEQKAKTAYQVADIVKNTGYAVNNAILNKGHTAAAIVGQTVHTAGEVLRSKGASATKIIQGTGHLASSAVQSVGNIGSSLLRSKGELVGSALKTGAVIGTAALGTAANALAGGTYLVKAKGDAASNLISKGGRIASGVIGTKGRLISSVINAKGQFAAQIIEAKGRAAATLLETSGQKLTQLAEAIKSATSQKKPPPPYGWSEPSAAYAVPSHKEEQHQKPKPQHDPDIPDNYQHQEHQHHQQQPPAQLQSAEQPVNAQYQQNFQSYSQDYADSYYDPRDTYGTRIQRNSNHRREETPKGKHEAAAQQPSKLPTTSNLTEDDGSQDVSLDEDFQPDYTAYYPNHYSIRPHTDYYARYQWRK